MGIVLFSSRESSISNDLPLLSGELDWFPYISSPLPTIEGNTRGAFVAIITDDCPILEGFSQVSQSIPNMEGGLPVIVDPISDNSIIATSNFTFIEDELPLFSGSFFAGGLIADELPLFEMSMAGIIPSIGTISDESALPVNEGSCFTGFSIIGTVFALSGDSSATVPVVGLLNGGSVQPTLTGNIGIFVPASATLSSDLPILYSFLSGHVDQTSALVDSLPIISNGSIDILTGVGGNIEQSLACLNGSLSCKLLTMGELSDSFPVNKGSIQIEGEYEYGILHFIREEVH